jgi:hypothetical protein
MSSDDHLAALKARRRELKVRIQQGDTIARVQLERLRNEIDGIEYPANQGTKP